MIARLDTTGAGIADLLSQSMMMEAVADYAVEIVQAEVGQLVELSVATAREAGDDCAVEVELASTDHVDLLSVAASLDLADEGRLAEGVHLVVLSARLVQVLARLGGPIQVGLG
jgi:hypothetical protein